MIAAMGWFRAIRCMTKTISPKPLRLDEGERAAQALRLIGRFTWLRAAELGKLLYPSKAHARKYAEVHLRKLLMLRYVVARPLPGRDAGTAYVLATRGAQFLNDWNAGQGDYTYTAGTDWGTTTAGSWEPPRSWRHDLIATGVLACIRERMGWGVYPEPMLRNVVPHAEKHPDGLIVAGKVSVWLEVENARKSGRNIDNMVRALMRAGLRRPVSSFPGFTAAAPIASGMVALDPEARDERGRRLDHLRRVEHAMAKVPLERGARVQLFVAFVSFRGVGVDAVRLERRIFDGDTGHFMPQ